MMDKNKASEKILLNIINELYELKRLNNGIEKINSERGIINFGHPFKKSRDLHRV